MLLETVCREADIVRIGIGSSNVIDHRNPWTADETEEMIDAHLSEHYHNYTFHHIPDFRDADRWRDEVSRQLGSLDLFVSGNPYVRDLMKDTYQTKDMLDLIGKENHLEISGTLVRGRLATAGADYRSLLPEAVADWLEADSRIERFRKDWGKKALRDMPPGDAWKETDYLEEFEKVHGKSEQKDRDKRKGPG